MHLSSNIDLALNSRQCQQKMVSSQENTILYAVSHLAVSAGLSTVWTHVQWLLRLHRAIPSTALDELYLVAKGIITDIQEDCNSFSRLNCKIPVN